MTNKEILTKAIEKAKRNGYKDIKTILLYGRVVGDNEFYVMIFSHDFAKAFWGRDKEDCSSTCGSQVGYGCTCDSLEAWECALQEMVLEDDPIQYLAQFL